MKNVFPNPYLYGEFIAFQGASITVTDIVLFRVQRRNIFARFCSDHDDIDFIAMIREVYIDN